MAESIVDYFSLSETKELIECLKKAGLNFREEVQEKRQTALSGKTVVFTDELPSYNHVEKLGLPEYVHGSRFVDGGAADPLQAALQSLHRFAQILLAPAQASAQTPTPSNKKTADVAPLLKTASEALDRKDFDAAVKALTAVVEAEPEMPEAWFNLAYAYTGLNRDEEAG